MGDILYRGDCWFSDILYYRFLGDEMVNDLIYREDAIKAACKGFCHPGILCPDTGCKELEPIKNLPAAERWIPCSERLPKEYVDVIVTVCNVESPQTAYTMVAKWDSMGTKWESQTCWFDPYYNAVEDDCFKVVAWMPLPEPYKGKQDG